LQKCKVLFLYPNGGKMTKLTKFIKHLKQSDLTPQQFRTLKGQALSGNIIGAEKGLNKIKGGNYSEHNRKNGANSNRKACSIYK